MKSVNPTIGYVVCPFSGERSEVRQNKNGKLYYVGSGGQITPNRPAGQAWLKSNMQPLDDSTKEAVNAAPLEFGQRVLAEPAKPAEPTRSEVKIETVSVTDPQPKQPEEPKKETDSWTLL